MLLIALVLAAAACAASCVPSEVETTHSEPPVTLVLGAPSSTLIPYSSSLATRQLGSLVFQALVDIDATGTPTADLALEVPSVENRGVSADGLTVEFQLDPDARWHDGSQVTASDVEFTYELLESGALVSADPAVLKRIKSVTAVDDHRVRVTLTQADWLGSMRFLPFILPRHLLENTKDLVSDPYWERPVGSGPYRITEVARRRAVTLERAGERGLERIVAVFHDTPKEQLETWDAAGRAIWPGASVEPVGSERLSRTPSDTYRYWLFNVRPGRTTSSITVRRLIASVLSTSVPDHGGAWDTSADPDLDTGSLVGQLRVQGWSADQEGVLRNRGERLEAVYVYNIEGETDGYALDADVRTLRNRGVFDRRESTFAYGDYFDPGAVLPGGEWDVARVVMPEGTPVGTAWPFDASDVPSPANPGGLNLSGVDDPELERLAAALRKPHTAQESAKIRRSIGKRLDELCLVVPVNRLDSRVLSRGIDGVEAARADVDFPNSWAAWRVSGNRGEGAKR